MMKKEPEKSLAALLEKFGTKLGSHHSGLSDILAEDEVDRNEDQPFQRVYNRHNRSYGKAYA